MSLKRRIEQIEATQGEKESLWLQSLPDAELEEISNSGKNLTSEWMRTLTDDELLTIRDGKPGVKKLTENFNEYQKQNQANRTKERNR